MAQVTLDVVSWVSHSTDGETGEVVELTTTQYRDPQGQSLFERRQTRLIAPHDDIKADTAETTAIVTAARTPERLARYDAIKAAAEPVENPVDPKPVVRG